jgi:hypothetical protein
LIQYLPSQTPIAFVVATDSINDYANKMMGLSRLERHSGSKWAEIVPDCRFSVLQLRALPFQKHPYGLRILTHYGDGADQLVARDAEGAAPIIESPHVAEIDGLG